MTHENPDLNMANIWTYIEEIEPVLPQVKNKIIEDSIFWCQKAYNMSKERNIDNSIDYYSEGYKLDPDNYMISYNLGWIYAKIK